MSMTNFDSWIIMRFVGEKECAKLPLSASGNVKKKLTDDLL